MIETNIDIVCPAQSAVTIDDPSIDEEIKEWTTHVRDYQEKLLLSLNERASLLVNAERLELALNDATAMMCIAPSSPLGYLCAGNIHSLRGQCASAIKTYDDGLKRVPSSHSLYAQLDKARAAACDINNKRIDFISQLPFDVVVYHIIPRLLHRQTIIALGNPCSYFDVSRTWRQRMALANGLEYEVGPVALSDVVFRLSIIPNKIQHVCLRHEQMISHIHRLPLGVRNTDTSHIHEPLALFYQPNRSNTAP